MPSAESPSAHDDLPLADRIAADIVRRITSGELAAGDRITEQSLADTFHTSRGPVRDALKLLHTRGWIELLPRIGARVAQPEAAPTFESVLVGGAMLGLAFRFGVMKATEEQISELVERTKRVVAIGRNPAATPEAFARAAIETGNYAIALANNSRINEIVGPVPQGALSSFIPLSVPDRASMEQATDLWIDLATAFRMRDPLTAEQIGRRMTEASYRRIVEQQLRGAASRTDPASKA